MGLDLVELVMDVEDAFDISIPDEDAAKCDTVGKLIAITQEKIGNRPSVFCLTSRTFYRLRRALMSIAGVERRQVRLDTTLGELLPDRMRREQWAKLRLAGIRVPPLELTSRQIVLLGSISIVAALTVGAYYEHWGLLFVSAITFVILVFSLSRPLARQVPASCRTVRQMALIASVPSEQNDREQLGLTKREIAQKVRAIISEQLAVPLEKLTDDAHFIKDLGCD